MNGTPLNGSTPGLHHIWLSRKFSFGQSQNGSMRLSNSSPLLLWIDMMRIPSCPPALMVSLQILPFHSSTNPSMLPVVVLRYSVSLSWKVQMYAASPSSIRRLNMRYIASTSSNIGIAASRSMLAVYSAGSWSVRLPSASSSSFSVMSGLAMPWW